MLTKDKLIYDLLEIARAGRGSDDEPLTPELVGFWVDNTRAELIGQSVDKGRSINPDIVQVLPCVEIQQVDASECGCETTGCYIYRTKRQLPTAIETSNGHTLITRVAPIRVDSKAFSFLPYERAIWGGTDRFTSNIVRCFLRNKYIYILSKRFLGDKISVSMVANYPEELGEFTTCAGESCYTKESNYPISARMIETMKKKIIDTNFKISLSTKGDDINDANGII